MNKNKKQEIFNSAFLKKSKKAELTTQQIVILIVLIMSFVVILYFLFRLNLGESSEKEICYNSVVMKGNPVLSKGDVSLNCQRTYVCLSKDGSCESMTNPNIKKVGENPNETYRILADEMADCWWMFGEGKIDYIKDKPLERNYCSICTQLAFDESMKEIEEFNSGKIDKDKFYDYLAETQMSEGGETYAEYFLGTNNLLDFKQESFSETGARTFGEINLDSQYFVMMGIVSEIGTFYKVVGAVAIAAGIGLGAPIIAVAVIGAGTYTYGGEVFELLEPEIQAIIVEGDGVDNAFMTPSIIEANSARFDELNCKDVMSTA